MYNQFKNEFISNIYSDKIELDAKQINKVLSSLDKTAVNYDIYSKYDTKAISNNDTPVSVYEYIAVKTAEGCTKETLYVYRVILEIFFRYIKKIPQKVTANDIRDFLMYYQRNNNITNRTLDKYRGYICGYFKYMHDYGFITKNISKQVSPIKYEIKHKDVLTDYELELIRQACKTTRELAMVEFLIATACRIGELVKVKITDIDWNNNSVLFHGKGHKQGIGFFNARCRIALERYIEDRKNYGYNLRTKTVDPRARESEYLFIYDRSPYEKLSTKGAERVIKDIVTRVDAINTKHITPHRFRASTATSCYERGMSLVDIQQMLRHSNVQTTTIYLNASTERLKNEYNRFM